MGPNVQCDFEGGNGAVIEVSNDRVTVEAQAHGSPNPLWFYFRLGGLTPPHALRITIANAAKCLGSIRGWKSVRLVYSENNGRIWSRLPTGSLSDDLTQYSVSQVFHSREVLVAFCYPYTWADLRSDLVRWQASGHLEVIEAGTTQDGRTIPCVRIGSERAEVSAWITARHHAGETPGSYVFRGMMDFLCSASPLAARARSQVAFWGFPMMDIDGVVAGRYGKRYPPVDHYEDWARPTRPEVRAVRSFIESRADGHWCFIDLHAPGPDGNTFFVTLDESVPEGVRMKSDALAHVLRAQMPSWLGMTVEDVRRFPPNWVINAEPTDIAHFQMALCHNAPGMLFEIAYNKTLQGEYLTPTRYHQIGEALACALAHGDAMTIVQGTAGD